MCSTVRVKDPHFFASILLAATAIQLKKKRGV